MAQEKAIKRHKTGTEDARKGDAAHLHLSRHEGQELREVDGAVAVDVDLVDHVLELSLRRVLAERSHHRAELARGDGPIAVLVEEGCRQQREKAADTGVSDEEARQQESLWNEDIDSSDHL